MIYVYHIAVRKPNDVKGIFEIETDTIITSKKLSQEDAKKMALEVDADVYIEFVGTLKKPNKRVNYHHNILSKEEAVKKIYEWGNIHYDDENFEEKSKEIEVIINEKNEKSINI